jgi:hypothetical protein
MGAHLHRAEWLPLDHDGVGGDDNLDRHPACLSTQRCTTACHWPAVRAG